MAIAKLLIVDGVTLPSPSKYEFSIQDVSKGDSGRAESGKMYKGKVTEKRKIVLEWPIKKLADTATILNAFEPEYITVTFYDLRKNRTDTSEFYSGDRKAAIKTWWEGNQLVESIAVDIIER